VLAGQPCNPAGDDDIGRRKGAPSRPEEAQDVVPMSCLVRGGRSLVDVLGVEPDKVIFVGGAVELGPSRFLELNHQLGRGDARVLQLGPRQWRPTHGRGNSNGTLVGRRMFGSPATESGSSPC
jgi:hypothetical protein